MSDRRPIPGNARRRRRDLLTAAAAAGSAAGTAGCLQAFGTGGIDGGGTTENGTDETAPRTSTAPGRDDARETNASDPAWDRDADTVETFAAGDRDAVAFPENNEPHAVRLWNRVDDERAVRVGVGTPPSLELGLVGPVTVPAGDVLEIVLNAPTRYALTVSVDDADFGTVTVGRRWFDCNDSESRYALAEDGLVDYGWMTTDEGCPDPVVADATVDVADRGCASEDDATASVRYDGERVRVDGTFLASAPCYELSVADATYSDDTRTATVVVDATAPDEPCADCVGAIDYTATVTFDRDLPDRFEVRHRDASGDDERVGGAVRDG